MVRKSIQLAVAAIAGVIVSSEPLSAQYRGYGYSYNEAPDYYYGGGPAYRPFYDLDQPRPYAPSQAYSRSQAYPPPQSYDPPQAYAPDRASAPRAGYEPERSPYYVDPVDGGREQSRGDPDHRASDYDLGETANRHTVEEVQNPTRQSAGTIVIDTASRHLYLVQQGGRALQYGIGVGRQGFAWKGEAKVERKAEWPEWIPPKEMLKRRPDLPQRMAGGIENPLGARALYLFQGNRDTLFRIHGTNEPDTIGKAVSSGCIRMNNADVIDLYQRVTVGTKVVVL